MFPQVSHCLPVPCCGGIWWEGSQTHQTPILLHPTPCRLAQMTALQREMVLFERGEQKRKEEERQRLLQQVRCGG